MTETGPVLSENLGPPVQQSLDMTGNTQGPMGMDERAVSRGLNPLLPRLGNCAAATADSHGHGAHGRVSVRMRVTPSGRPIAARVSGGGGSAEFVLCVRRVFASARFGAFNGADAIVGWGFDID